MIAAALAFLVMLNPFALFIYLQPIMRELYPAAFRQVLFRASIISLSIFLIFAVVGEFFFSRVLGINFEAFRIFGGIILFSYAFMFIIQGRRSLIAMKEDLHDLASEIALPFMVGAGTISLSILLGHRFGPAKSLLVLPAVVAVNFFIVVTLTLVRKALSAELRVAFDKVMEMSLRLNGFFLGSIGLNMVIIGINNIYFPNVR
jgi:multiple antibiotic resistance protein